MTREKIEDAKEVVIPYIMEELRHYNVDGNGEADAEEARKDLEEIFSLAIKALEQEQTIKALGEELRKARKGIADEKVLIGYNMAVAICNKHLGESEVTE